MTRRAENLVADLVVVRRERDATEAKLAEATTQLAERGEAQGRYTTNKEQ